MEYAGFQLCGNQCRRVIVNFAILFAASNLKGITVFVNTFFESCLKSNQNFYVYVYNRFNQFS